MIVFTADLHLAPRTWAALPNLKGDAYSAWQQIVFHCIDNQAQALILGGDIFNACLPDSFSVNEFISGILKLASANITVGCIQGQHDRAVPPWFTTCKDAVHNLAEQPLSVTCDKAKLKIYGFDNMPADQMQAALSKLPKDCDVLVLHQTLRSIVPMDGRWDLDDAWIPDHVRVALLGDLHIQASEGRCHYSGSTHLRSVAESPDKGFIELHASKTKLTIARKMLASRGMHKYVVDSPEALIQAIAGIKELPKTDIQPLVVATISPTVPNAYDYIAKVCEEAPAFLITDDMPMQAATDETLVAIGEITMAALVAGLVKDDKDLQNFITRLLNAMDPAGELMKIKKELGVPGGIS